MSRLIPKDLIPHTLWDNESSVMHLPPQLVSSWKILLEKYGLLDKAKTRAPEGFEGGRNKVDTDNHFAWRFSGSSARVMLSMLDPKQDLYEISDVFTRLFSGNRIFLADLPCGSGAASISILSVYCELRKQKLVPREPLEVIIIGGEISPFARNYASEGLECLRKDLEEQAITIEYEITDWDVCDPFSNTHLIKQLTLRSQSCAAKVLVLANFSGYLQRNNKWDDAKKQIDELFRHNLGESSVALWIEPNINEVTNSGGFIFRLIKWFKEKFASIVSNIINYQATSAEVKHPLVEETFTTNLVVVRFDLPTRKRL